MLYWQTKVMYRNKLLVIIVKTRVGCTQLIVGLTMSELGFGLGNLGSFFWLYVIGTQL